MSHGESLALTEAVARRPPSTNTVRLLRGLGVRAQGKVREGARSAYVRLRASPAATGRVSRAVELPGRAWLARRVTD